MSAKEELISSLDRLNTTTLGVERIRRNLCLDTDDVVAWCRKIIKSPLSHVTREGKNWYISADACRITINAHSLTVITAHKI